MNPAPCTLSTDSQTTKPDP